jgi:hypothetical protein
MIMLNQMKAGIAAAAGLLAIAGSASGDITFSGRNWTTYDHVFAGQYEPDQSNQYVAADANTGVMTARFGTDAGDDSYMTTPITIGVGDIVRYDYHLTEESRNFRGIGASTYVGDSRTGFLHSGGDWATGRVATYNSRWEQYFESNNPAQYAYAARGLDDYFTVRWKFNSATTATVTLTLEGQTTPYATFTDSFTDIANITQFRVGLWDAEQDVTLSNFTHTVWTSLQPGDTDGDHDVDLDDFAAIRDHFRLPVNSRSEGDLDENGIVDFLDFGEWKDNYPYFPEGTGSSTNATVPEPSSCILGLACLLFVLCDCRRTRRSRCVSA